MIGKVSVRLATLCAITMVCTAYAKEYILEDLVAMETGRRNTHQHQAAGLPADGRKGSGRLQKTPRAVEPKKNATSDNRGDKDDDDEDKKTLAQQVADGKYGLIQKELFVDPPRRPGIISYEVNPEVPKDNVNNLGGLKPEEIWLAENHLLVLAGGGGFDDAPRVGPVWPPIDDYKAPPRQVKIPPEPKVPPPFPVQLRPGGPTEFIRGANGTGGPPPFPFFPPPPPPGNFTGGGGPPPFFGPPINPFRGNFTPGNGPVPPFPFPPFPINGSIGPPPFGAFPPPGANFLPPPVNLTGQLDEDDPSIYYPPPYDFVYKSKDNTTAVPPGPLVPGIVLPPPPDFFAPLEDEKRKPKPAKRPQPTQHKPKRPRPSVTVLTTITTTTTTTKRPAVKIVTDDPSQHVDLNEVTPTTVAHALPPDAVVRGWVPIPAPRPFYISGIGKPHFKNVRARPQPTRHNDYIDGYDYGKPLQHIYGTPDDEPLKWPSGYNTSQPVYYRPTSTIAPPAPYPAKGGKAIKNYYFYDEPVSTPQPQPQPYYTSETPAGSYYREPVSPLQYFYITESPAAHAAHSTTTARPPVFEYSYTAPGYGTVEAPRLSVLTTTAAPPAARPSYHHATAAAPYDYRPPAVTTPSPLAHRPALQSTASPSPYIVQTENPYHAYFTHHDYPLIDDITKKYFTVFGQKLNNGDGPTTPLASPVQDVTDRPSPRPTGARVKFPVETPVRPTYSTAFWSTTTRAPPPQDVRYQQYPEYDYFYGGRGSDYEYPGRDYYDDGRTRQSAALTAQRQHQHLSYVGDTRVNELRPRPAQDPDAQHFARPNADLAYLVGPSKTQAAQSLRFDTRVNYLRPHPTQNPDAEQFDPAYGPLPPHRPADSFDPETRQKLLLDLYQRLLGRQQDNAVHQRYRPYSLADDIRVNDRLVGQNVTVPPDVEVFDPDVFRPRKPSPTAVAHPAGDAASNAALIAYRLPGNGGGHFYFLTPQSVAAPDRRRNVHRRQSARQRSTADRDDQNDQRTIQS